MSGRRRERKIAKKTTKLTLSPADYEKLAEILGKPITFKIHWIPDIAKLLKPYYQCERKIKQVKAQPEKWKDSDYWIGYYTDCIKHLKSQIQYYLLHSQKREGEILDQQKKEFFDMFFKPILQYKINPIELQARCFRSGFYRPLSKCKNCEYLIQIDLEKLRVICRRNKKELKETL